ncbi:DUF6123 family protein [Mesobacillus maritimus]|uniref:DUF6123 family protein n=1 Tax=Mesobacillus maritimus TaxID=1643336 RepID=UPI00203CA7D9|nr:DUF6123 family protein [Mesobacillus maritimus]MCM3588750.1 DUF6123 family protein [Mesobacillus maritimus]MCM3672126.1 DUF6123 family protein [Mesobacillus maritimus]
MNTLEEYLLILKSKGFHFGDDAIGFIYFGKQYTEASDELIKVAIELTLKIQKEFDGSFYISLLETFLANGVRNRNQAFRYVKEKQILLL